MRLDALQSRTATAERLLSEARQNLIARTEEVRAFDRKSVEATIGRNNSEKRLAQIEAAHEARERQIKDLESRPRRAHRAQHAMTKTLKTRETALARAEEKIAALTERNGASGSRRPGQPHQYRKARRGSQFGAATRAHGARGGRRRAGSRAQGQFTAAKRGRGAALDAAARRSARRGADGAGRAANDEALPRARKRARTADFTTSLVIFIFWNAGPWSRVLCGALMPPFSK